MTSQYHVPLTRQTWPQFPDNLGGNGLFSCHGLCGEVVGQHRLRWWPPKSCCFRATTEFSYKSWRHVSLLCACCWLLYGRVSQYAKREMCPLSMVKLGLASAPQNARIWAHMIGQNAHIAQCPDRKSFDRNWIPRYPGTERYLDNQRRPRERTAHLEQVPSCGRAGLEAQGFGWMHDGSEHWLPNSHSFSYGKDLVSKVPCTLLKARSPM